MGGHRISPRRPFCPERPVAPCASSTKRVEEAGLKKAEEVMEILEAFDLTGSLRAAAELCGCDHKTVAHWVAARDCCWRRAAGRVATAPGGRPVRGEDRGVGRAVAREDPGGQGAREAGRDGLYGVGAHHPSGGR